MIAGRRRLVDIGLLLLIMGAWFAARPYDGIWHDAVLYTAQALRRLYPENYAFDLFFRYGSQDSYTIFPSVHAAAISFLGIEGAALALTILGKVLWFCALFCLFSAIFRGKDFWFSLALIATLDPYFDGHGVFSWGESFVTARLYAEAFVLAGLAMLLREYRIFGTFLLVLAALMHPLIAIVGCLVAGVFTLMRFSLRHVVVMVLLPLLFVVSLLVLYGISPLDRLLLVYDESWLAYIRNRNVSVFLDTWDISAFSRVLLIIVILMFGIDTAHSVRLRQLSIAALVALLFLISLAWFGGGVWHSILLTQLQLWRGLWLIQLIAWGIAAYVLLALFGGGQAKRLLAALMLSALLLEGPASGVIALCAWLLYQLLRIYYPDWKPGVLTVGLISGVLLMSVLLRIASLSIVATEWGTMGRPGWLVFFYCPLFLVGLVSIILWRNVTRVIYQILVLGACTLYFISGVWLFFSKYSFGQVEDQREVETLREIIPGGATVYRPEALSYVWFSLGRANFASGIQSAGVLFSRETAVESSRRLDLLWSLGFSDGNPYCLGVPEAGKIYLAKPSHRSLHQTVRVLCSEVDLDYLLLPKSAGYSVGFGYEPIYQSQGLILFDCADVRKKLLHADEK